MAAPKYLGSIVRFLNCVQSVSGGRQFALITYHQCSTIHAHLAGELVFTRLLWCHDHIQGFAHRQVDAHAEAVEQRLSRAGAGVLAHVSERDRFARRHFDARWRVHTAVHDDLNQRIAFAISSRRCATGNDYSSPRATAHRKSSNS